ncbi:MAG: hypothetical protein HUU31_25795 [Anaerolineae bacterium]|nr:hypothetical protein [Anaerolineae bacterium]
MLLVVLLTLTSGHILAQEGSGHTDTLVITWPPPVTEVWGVGDVLGTANITNMVYFYLEYKPLNDDLSEPENAPWLPATLALREPVTDGVLATLDTTRVADGLYALRLTAATTDNQTYHYVVTPIRVDNARFEAVIARIRAEAGLEGTATQLPDMVPVEDTTPRVTPSGTALNIRRCDIVDNDRCPIVAQLAPGIFAEITGRNPANTFYQVRLASGVSGWASRTVLTESGETGRVPVVNPPAPLPVPVQPILPGGVASSVAPNGMAIQGAAVCNQTFNVQINLANTGSTVSPAGSLTLQDTNISTGTVTFSGTASYPAIAPSGNFVVVVPVTTSVYYGEQHQLRAFTNSREFAITYTLGQGNCASAPTPVQPVRGQRNFASGECTLVISSAGLSATPEGQVTFVLDQTGSYPALQVLSAGGVLWYQISYADSLAWLPSPNVTSYQGNCNP